MNSFWGLKFLSYPGRALLFSLLVWGNLCWAEVPAPSDRNGAKVEAGARERDKIERTWFMHRRFLEKGDWERSRSELEKVYQWKLDQGIRNHYAYALALVRESQWDARVGKSGGAAELLNYAEDMAPDCSQVSIARARWLGSQILDSWENVPRAIFAWFDGIWLSFYNQEEALPQIANLTLWVLLSFLLTFVVFAFSLFVRYHSFLAQHLKRLSKAADMGPVPWFFLTLALLFSPFFLGLGWMWVITFWILIFWPYAGRPDRLVAIALLVLLLLLPTGIRFYSSVLLSITGHGIPEIFSANTGAWNLELYRRILAMNQLDPEDQDVLQALGLVEKRMGKFREAEQRFLQLSKLDPRSGAALVNLGNVYLATDRLEQAMEAYRNAARSDPLRAEAYYNLGQAYLLKRRKKEGEEEIQRARGLDPSLIFHQTRISSRNPNRLVIDRTFDLSQVWRRILTPTPERDEIARGLWNTLWGGIPLEYGDIAIGLLFLLLGGVHMASRRLSFIRNSDFSQRISLIVPGLGHLIRGNSKEGILYLFIFILFVVQVILWGGWLSNPMVLNPTFSFPRMFILAILFFLFYGRVQHRMKHIRSREGSPHWRESSE